MKVTTKDKRNNSLWRKSFFIPSIVLILGIGFILRLILSPFGTLTLDQNTFIAWSRILVEGRFSNFYNGWSDYFPGYLYILWFLGKISAAVGFPSAMLYKLPAIGADILIGYLIYRILEELRGKRWGLIGASLYLFNPATLVNSTLWGQIDSIPALFVMLSVWLVNINPIISSIFFGLGVSVKPQVAFILPALLFVMMREKWRIEKILIFGLISFLTTLLLFVPFQNIPNFLDFIIGRISVSFNQYPYTSINAFNFWGISGLWLKDSPLFGIFGIVAYLVAFAFSVFKLKKWETDEAKYILTTILFLSSFIFFTRVHERHLLLALPTLIIMSASFSGAAIALVGFSVIYVLNLYYSFNWITYDFVQVISEPFIKILSLSGVLLFVYLLFVVNRGKGLTIDFSKILSWLERRGNKSVAEKFPQTTFSSRTLKIVLGTILLFAFVTRVGWLNSPKNEYFDEVYHAFTARIILHGDPKAWEWWNPHPEGFAYEWTHPPLAKLGMVLGMLVFGENSFGWRIPGALLGVGSVFLVYLIAKRIFRDELIGILAAAVFSLDGLALVMSRIGMNDSYHLFFILLSIFLFVKNKNFFSAIAFGLAISSKWAAIWGIPIFGIWWLSQKRNFELSYLWFLVLPPLIYLVTYTPMFLTGHGLDIFWGMQKQMWWYHTGLRATHPYTSPWWSWPLIVRPIYLYTSEEIGGMVARIYAMGNPVVFWFGLSSVVLAAVTSFVERNKKLGFVIFGYLVFFAAWAASPRIMFLYHYLPSIPFMAIATAYILRRNAKITFAYLLIGLLVFIYFYPHWAGLTVPLWLDTSYYWFNSWR